jgi:hypothetical protein
MKEDNMFKIENDTIKVTRATKGVIELSIDDYTFNDGDTIEFRIYNKKKLNEPPVMTKEIKVTQACTSVDIELTCEDTDIGEPINKMVEYWYEIELNDEQTIIGFDDITGPKILELYPKGVEEDDQI